MQKLKLYNGNFQMWDLNLMHLNCLVHWQFATHTFSFYYFGGLRSQIVAHNVLREWVGFICHFECINIFQMNVSNCHPFIHVWRAEIISRKIYFGMTIMEPNGNHHRHHVLLCGNISAPPSETLGMNCQYNSTFVHLLCRIWNVILLRSLANSFAPINTHLKREIILNDASLCFDTQTNERIRLLFCRLIQCSLLIRWVFE